MVNQSQKRDGARETKVALKKVYQSEIESVLAFANAWERKVIPGYGDGDRTGRRRS